MIQTKNHILNPGKKQISGLQNCNLLKPDTIYVTRETTKSTFAENQHNDYINQQQLKAKDEQIQRLQNQIDAIQNASITRPRQSFVFRERAQHQPCNDQQSDQMSRHLLQSQNDTIQHLKSQLRSLQLQPKDRNSVKSKKKNQTSKIIDKPVDEHKSIGANPTTQATSKLAKNRVSYMVLKTSLSKDATAAGILNKISEFDNKRLINPNLSGLTNSSAKAKINKEITHKRFNYLSEKNTPRISKENIFFQNYKDVLASIEVVSIDQN